jgi:putative phosphoribosyl transferase
MTSVREIDLPPLGRSGLLRRPPGAKGLVLFAHGSGSGKGSPRNNYVADGLAEAGLASLLFDLLTPAEEIDRANVFDIGLLASRLAEATIWMRTLEETAPLAIGYFGASTGAAAALVAAALPDSDIRAIVSRGGRPDMAAAVFDMVRAPTLLIVGSLDEVVIELNQDAFTRLDCEKELAIVEGATHLFEEPGTLDQVVELARSWFATHLGAPAP